MVIFNLAIQAGTDARTQIDAALDLNVERSEVAPDALRPVAQPQLLLLLAEHSGPQNAVAGCFDNCLGRFDMVAVLNSRNGKGWRKR